MVIYRWRVYLRNVRSGELTTTVITQNRASVNVNDNPSDVRAAAEKKLGSAWSAYRHHRIRHTQH